MELKLSERRLRATFGAVDLVEEISEGTATPTIMRGTMPHSGTARTLG